MVARGQSEHHAGQPLSGLSCTSDEGIGTRMFNAVMVVYVRFVQSQCVKCCVRVQFWCRDGRVS
jgi:hypothetical protein